MGRDQYPDPLICDCHDLMIWLTAQRKGSWTRVKPGEKQTRRWGEEQKEQREEQEKWESESAWMLSAAAEWHFIGICQLNSDWPDIANPPRCSALTDECVTVLCGRKQRGGLTLLWPAGPGVNRASQGPLSEGFGEIWRTGWSDVRELGGEEQILSTIWDRGCTCDFPSPPLNPLHFGNVCLHMWRNVRLWLLWQQPRKECAENSRIKRVCNLI